MTVNEERIISNDELERLEKLNDARSKILKEIRKVIVGQEVVIDQILIALFANGHCLIEGVPGLAKTLMISTLAEALSLNFHRIQFTPDLMPSDITGTDILTESRDEAKRHFEYIRGPVFSNVILADEINRTPPKTQAALLQAMQERQVTAGNHTYELDKPFLVLATQNPIEQEGTYPLPEAQLDRFMFNINIDYPSFEEEKMIVKETTMGKERKIEKIMNAEDIVSIQKAVLTIPVSEHVIDFAVRLVRSTRPAEENSYDFVKKWVTWGAGPRASQYMILGAKTKAALEGRLSPSVDDVKKVAEIVLQHRVLVSFAAEAEGMKPRSVIRRLVEKVDKETD